MYLQMSRIKTALVATAFATIVIVPATAFAAGGHHAHLQAYRGKIASGTTQSSLVVAVKHGTRMTFAITSKTRFIEKHQRLTTEPVLTAGERVLVRARELKNQTFVARSVRIAPAKSA
jgi:hypothetical protein